MYVYTLMIQYDQQYVTKREPSDMKGLKSKVLNLWSILSKQNHAKHQKRMQKTWQMGTHTRELSESYPMNTNMTGFRRFSKIFASSNALDNSVFSIGWVKD